jgi:lipopolysaccharide/colanic/teichoic acid biosynthesis glycosyltransferase
VDKLPQLFHVLRGEISLRDSFSPLTLSEALRLGSERQQYVSILLEIPEAQIQGNNSGVAEYRYEWKIAQLL